MKQLVPFDRIVGHVNSLLRAPGALPANIPDLYVVRDLLGKVRLSISDEIEGNDAARDSLGKLAVALHEALGAHSYPPDSAVLSFDRAFLKSLTDESRQIHSGVYWIDRLVTGSDHGTCFRNACTTNRVTTMIRPPSDSPSLAMTSAHPTIRFPSSGIEDLQPGHHCDLRNKRRSALRTRNSCGGSTR